MKLNPLPPLVSVGDPEGRAANELGLLEPPEGLPFFRQANERTRVLDLSGWLELALR